MDTGLTACYQRFHYRADFIVKKFLVCLICLWLGAAQATPPSEDIPLYALSLLGSPYLLGGTTPESGLDCSGLVGHVFLHTVGIQLPRDSLAISAATQPLPDDELAPGDLVFFNTLDRPYSHVGIYLGEGRFVHAASRRSGSVMVSQLHDPYWQERYEGARRVQLPGASGEGQTE